MLRAMKASEGSSRSSTCFSSPSSSKEHRVLGINPAMAASAPSGPANHAPKAAPPRPHPAANRRPLPPQASAIAGFAPAESACKENEEPNTNAGASTNPTDLKPFLRSAAPSTVSSANARPDPSSRGGGGGGGGGGLGGFLGMKRSSHGRESGARMMTIVQKACEPSLSRSNSSLSSLGRRKKKTPPADDSAGDSRFLESPTTPSHSSHVWDDPEAYGESYIAPASAWSTLGSRALLCRPLPLDVGRCVCYITREPHDGANGFVLYTDEGYGRQDRKLAVAFHKRRAGRSEFVVFSVGLEPSLKSGGAILGRVQANLLGTRFLIWDEVEPTTSQQSSAPPLLGVVMFQPTATTLTGSFRVMRVLIPKYQSTQIVSSTYRENGLAQDWEENTRNSYQLYSRKPVYNKATKSYELDFKDRTKRSTKILTSARNLQLTMNENGKQTILMLGKIGKSKFLMEYRFPMTAYQAFSISLASMDSKLCCSL